VGPWDPNWRPDPTGRRLQGMRAARRGALLAAVIFGFLVGVASVVGLSTVGSLFGLDVMIGAIVAGFSLPGVALLGASLTSAARGTGASAVSAGLAIGVGVPVAAVTSAMIGVFVVAGLFDGLGSGTAVAGVVLRQGVTAAERIWPLIVFGAAAWVVLVRRLTRPLPDVALEPDGTDRQT
jgi:hypothetical protein